MSIGDGNKKYKYSFEEIITDLISKVKDSEGEQTLELIFKHLEDLAETASSIGVFLNSPLVRMLQPHSSIQFSHQQNKEIYILTRVK